MSTLPVSSLVSRLAARLGSGALLAVLLALLLINIIVPDPLPFVDEALLALGALLLARKRTRKVEAEPARPAEDEPAPTARTEREAARP